MKRPIATHHQTPRRLQRLKRRLVSRLKYANERLVAAEMAATAIEDASIESYRAAREKFGTKFVEGTNRNRTIERYRALYERLKMRHRSTKIEALIARLPHNTHPRFGSKKAVLGGDPS